MKKILVINNDFDTMALLKDWLERKGYEIKFTGNRQAAIKLIKEFAPYLIIIDILQRPLLLDIKSHKEFAGIPLLLMTGYTSKPLDKHLAVDDSIEKPFNLSLFEQKIRRLLKDNVEA
jgi:DNA-binding response OmpR family regulator